MDTVTYPQPEVIEAVNRLVTPVKINVREDRETPRRFGVAWSPVFLLLREGTDVPSRTWQGWLPPGSFVAELKVGLAYLNIQERRFKRAWDLSREVVASAADRERRGEARYWEAVSHAKGTGDGDALPRGHAAVRRDFADTAAANKLSYPPRG